MKLLRQIILCTLLIVAGKVSSQVFKAGLSAGFTVSDINGINTAPNRKNFHKLGFGGGIVANARIAQKSLVQFEINFTQKGSMQPPDSMNNGYYKIALGYVEIPVMLRQQIFFNWKGNRINKFDIEFGASYGKLVQLNVIGNTNYSLNGTTNDQYYNTNDVSILAGLDFNFTKNICFNFRYSNSVIPAIKRSALRAGFVSQTFNRGNNMVFQFGFKFFFGAKQKSTPDQAPVPAQQ
jgi:hypothetical protein